MDYPALINSSLSHACHTLTWKTIKSDKLKVIISFFATSREIISTKMHSIDGRFVLGPSDTLFAGLYVCSFQPGNFTGWGSEGVKVKEILQCFVVCTTHSPLY